MPTFNTTAEKSNKNVAALNLVVSSSNQLITGNEGRLIKQQMVSSGSQQDLDEQLATTEQCDFEVCADTQRNWRDLIKDNPFEAAANQSAQEQFPPRESLMMLAESSNKALDSEGFCVFGDDSEQLTRSDRFA